MIFDPREVGTHAPVIMCDNIIEQVGSIKYLGVQIDNQMKWNVHVDFLCGKLAQRLHFLRHLRLFGMIKKMVKAATKNNPPFNPSSRKLEVLPDYITVGSRSTP